MVFYEMSHPLVSGDGHDISVVPSDVLGVRVGVTVAGSSYAITFLGDPQLLRMLIR